MLVIFKKEKMLERLEKEGRLDEVTPEDIAIMDRLNGKKCNTYNWQAYVLNKPVAYCEEEKMYVNINDCQ